MLAPSLRLRSLTDRYIKTRNRRLLSAMRQIDGLTEDYRQRFVGLVAAHYVGKRTGIEEATRLSRRLLVDLSAVLEAILGDVWDWAWRRTTRNWVAAVPMGYWVQRLRPIALRRRGYWEELVSEAEEPVFDTEIELQRVIDGQLSREEAREVIRQIEFPPPSETKVNRILQATNADDGLSAMQRIKTVARTDLPKLRQVIARAMAEADRTSAVANVSENIRPFLKGHRGINWKARRIARTEGVRVAQAAQDEARENVSDLLQGVEVFTMQDANVRDEHRARWWPAKTYYRTGTGTYIARDGERLPQLPAGPNCRCSTRDVLEDDLLKGAPAAKYGPGPKTDDRRVSPQQKVLGIEPKKVKPKAPPRRIGKARAAADMKKATEALERRGLRVGGQLPVEAGEAKRRGYKPRRMSLNVLNTVKEEVDRLTRQLKPELATKLRKAHIRVLTMNTGPNGPAGVTTIAGDEILLGIDPKNAAKLKQFAARHPDAFVDPSFSGIVRHELSHALEHALEHETAVKMGLYTDTYFASEYAKTNFREKWAEFVTGITQSGFKRSTLPKASQKVARKFLR